MVLKLDNGVHVSCSSGMVEKKRCERWKRRREKGEALGRQMKELNGWQGLIFSTHPCFVVLLLVAALEIAAHCGLGARDLKLHIE